MHFISCFLSHKNEDATCILKCFNNYSADIFFTNFCFHSKMAPRTDFLSFVVAVNKISAVGIGHKVLSDGEFAVVVIVL